MFNNVFLRFGLLVFTIAAAGLVYDLKSHAGESVAVVPATSPVIDGKLDDWSSSGASTFEIPKDTRDATDSPYGKVKKLWVTHDDKFLYFRVDFVMPRPFTDATQSEFKKGYRTNQRFICLDVDGDSRVDYRTNQINLKTGGMNNTYVSKWTGKKWVACPWRPGKKSKWSHPAVGTLSRYNTNATSIEIRIPREPLGIHAPKIGVQVLMQYRDTDCSNKWTSEHYPSREKWFIHSLKSYAGESIAQSPTARTVNITPTDTAPVIDGRLDDQAWRGKAVLRGFILNRPSKPASAQTEAIITYDSKNLYFGIRAFYDGPSGLVTKATQAEPSRVWGDDVVEIFVDATHDRRSFHHFGINALATCATIFTIKKKTRDISTQIDAQFDAAVERGPKAWVIEVAIPFTRFGSAPAPGEVWGLNVNRGNPGLREYSSWSGVQGGFCQPLEFGSMRFPSGNGLRIENRGLTARNGNADQSNVFAGVLESAQPVEMEAAVTLSVGSKKTFSTRRKFKSDGKAPLRFTVPYIVSGLEGETVSFHVNAGGKILYKNTMATINATAAAVVWQTIDPLYKKLFGKDGPGMASEGAMMWGHQLRNSAMASVCLKHAQPYELGEVYANAAKRRLRYFNQCCRFVNMNLFRFKDYADKLGLKFIYMGNRYAKANGKPYDSSGPSYLIDPENQEIYLQEVRDLLGQWKQYIWGFNTGDEIQEHDLLRGLQFHYNDAPYPFMEHVNREVKEKFGYGKFGIPTSMEDKNPFRWIAYRRWYNEQFSKFQKRIYETVKSIAPDVYVISSDSLAAIMPLDYAGYSRYVDIMTHQLYPRNNSYQQPFAFVTKTVRDLSGKPTMPCIHVENYANTYRPDEVRELMSQVYRAGGEGFHIYMSDTANRGGKNDMGHDRYGSWPRWETVMGVLDLAASNPRPRLPKADCAILYSDDTHMGEMLGGWKCDSHYRALFNLLGPAARGWFKVISDSQIARNEVKLDSFRTIYIPNATHQRRKIVAALAGYVERGGRLVVLQPDAFTWHLDGTRLDDLRAKLLVPTGKAGVHTHLKNGLAVFSGSGVALQTGKGITVLLRYKDGSAAAVRKTVGKGAVYYFGFEPLYLKAMTNKGWRAFWKSLHSQFGHAVDLDIWRFTFPDVPAARKIVAPPAGLCLTNNYVVWDTNEAIPMRNRKIAGATYTYSLAPDLAKDEGGVMDIPFTKGDLMDRRHGVDSPNTTYAVECNRFAVGWSTKEPITITFDLGAAYQLDRIWLLFNGELPDTVIEGKVGTEWKTIGRISGRVPADKRDFPAVTIPLDHASPAIRRLRMRLGARAEKNLILPEVEIWASGHSSSKR